MYLIEVGEVCRIRASAAALWVTSRQSANRAELGVDLANESILSSKIYFAKVAHVVIT